MSRPGQVWKRGKPLTDRVDAHEGVGYREGSFKDRPTLNSTRAIRGERVPTDDMLDSWEGMREPVETANPNVSGFMPNFWGRPMRDNCVGEECLKGARTEFGKD